MKRGDEKIIKVQVIRRRSDERSFSSPYIGKEIVKSFSHHVVRRRGDKKSFSKPMIREKR
jgi:hypothetical protein